MFINELIEKLVIIGNDLLFFNIIFWSDKYIIPFLIAWLLAATVFFTLRFCFVNFLYLKESIVGLVSKKNDDEQLKLQKTNHITGQETSRKIVWFNIGSSVDLGSIFGVATVVATTGPGVIFWIMIVGILSSSMRFAEVVASHMFRSFYDNKVSGGPQFYIFHAFNRLMAPRLGKVVSMIFSILLLLSTFCSIQLNQTVQTIIYFAPWTQKYGILISLLCAGFVCIMLFSGFNKMTTLTSKMVPIMSKIYLLATIIILLAHWDSIMPTIGIIAQDALRPTTGIVGILTTLIVGTQRIFFCNETGMGSGAIAHAKTLNKNSVSEGILAMAAPIITSTIVCTCSGLVVTVTKVYLYHANGIDMVANAFGTVHQSFKFALAIIVPLFGISTTLAWAYYGQTIWQHICSKKTVFIYNILLLISYTICGTISNFRAILNLADIVNLSIAIPNIVALYLLSNLIAKKLKEYRSTKNTI